MGKMAQKKPQQAKLLKGIPDVEIAYFDNIPVKTLSKEVEAVERALIWCFQPLTNKIPNTFAHDYNIIMKQGCSFYQLEFPELLKLPTLWTPSYFAPQLKMPQQIQ